MNIGNSTGTILGIKLINGKIKPKYGTGVIFAIIIMSLLFIGFLDANFGEIISFNVEFIGIPGITTCSIGYLLLISPYTQNSNNYYIEFQSESSLAGFKLYYKGKLISVKYNIDKVGKIAFANNKKKIKYISYADGSEMSNFVKYKIINYFSKWLKENNLLSSEVTLSLE